MTPISGTGRRNSLFTLFAAIVVVFAAVAVSQASLAHASTPTTASITITKAWEGGTAGSLPTADFTTAGTGVSDFSLTEAAPTKTFDGLAPGDYTFTEGSIDGWTLTSVNCSDQPTSRAAPLAASHTLNVTVVAGENLACTFTNTMQAPTTGTLTVIKMVDNTQNANATAVPGDFMLSVMSNGADVAGSPAAGSDTGTPYKLDPGDYTVSESGGPTGYVQSFSGDCDSTGAVSLAAGDNKTCTMTNTAQAADVLGNVTIKKEWVPLDATTIGPDAAFTATGPGTAPFTLTAAAPSMTLAGVATGNYSFTEAAIDGWKLTAINCSGGSIADTIGVNLSGRTLKLGLGDAEDVTCTFVNTEQAPDTTGSITIEKVWTGDNGLPAEFTTAGDGLSDFTLTPTENSQVFDGLNAGDYTFTEAAQEGWSLTNINCSDQVKPLAPSIAQIHSVTVTLAENEDVTCVFTNTPTGASTGTGSIDIEKVWAANGGGTTGPDAFFTAANNDPSTFTLSSAQGGSTSQMYTDLAAGDYTFAEAAIDGWTLGAPVCTDTAGNIVTTGDGTTASPLTISLTDGEVVTCVFTNTQQPATGTGSINIEKVWAANGGGTTGPDAVFASPNNTPATFTLSSGTTSQMFSALAAGSYSFSEAAIDGWTLGTPVCTDTAGGTVAVTGAGTDASPLAVALTDGEVVTCVFTNTQQPATGTGAINIEKVWAANGGGTTGPDAVFASPNNTPATFTLNSGTTSRMFSALAAGSYSFSEAAIDGWTLGTPVCTDTAGGTVAVTGAGTDASPLAVALTDGEVVTCVFTNTQQPATGTGAINITKVWHDAAGGTVAGSSAVFTASGTGTSGFTLDDANPSNAFTNLAAGNFSFGEAAITGWTLTSVVCVLPDGTVVATTGTGTSADPTAFALADGQVINCVFTNTQANTAAVSPFDLSGLFPVTNPGSNVANTTNPPLSNISDSTINTPSNSGTNGSTPNNTSTNNTTANPVNNNNTDSSTLAPVTNDAVSSGAVAQATPAAPSTGTGSDASRSGSGYDLAVALGGALAIALGIASFAFTKRRD